MLIFSYGTLTEPIICNRVLGHPVDTEDAALHGYIKVCGWDYLTIVPGDGNVKGVVFEADDEDVHRMDVWEDVSVYELVPLTVEVNGVPKEASCYVMPEPPEHYETVGDDCIAAIPIRDIIRDMESMFGRFHGTEDKDR